MRAGRLDRYVTLQRKTISQSDSGEVQEEWSTLEMRRPASYKPLRGSERYVGAQISATEQVEFQIRFSEDVAELGPTDRLIYPALGADSPQISAPHVYDILAVHELGRREGLVITASRRPDVAP